MTTLFIRVGARVGYGMGKARTKPARPFSPRELAAIAKGKFGPASNVVARLLATIHDSSFQEALKYEPAKTVTVDPNESYAGREKVLVVLHPDGWCEAYGAAWTDIRILNLFTGENVDEEVEQLPECYRALFWPCNLKAFAMPHFKTRPGDWIGAAIERAIELGALP